MGRFANHWYLIWDMWALLASSFPSNFSVHKLTITFFYLTRSLMLSNFQLPYLPLGVSLMKLNFFACGSFTLHTHLI